tara:strand:- start:32 stop:208 length:177 start_codon:yes stop_codon:yes gene_type:complete
MYRSRLNPDVTYSNKSDRDSDDRYFRKLIAKNHAELLKAEAELAEHKKAFAEYLKTRP